LFIIGNQEQLHELLVKLYAEYKAAPIDLTKDDVIDLTDEPDTVVPHWASNVAPIDLTDEDEPHPGFSTLLFPGGIIDLSND